MCNAEDWFFENLFLEGEEEEKMFEKSGSKGDPCSSDENWG